MADNASEGAPAMEAAAQPEQMQPKQPALTDAPAAEVLSPPGIPATAPPQNSLPKRKLRQLQESAALST